VSLYRRNDSPNWYTLVRWKGYPRISLSTGTPNKARAVAIERTLFVLRGSGRRDILELLAAKRLRLPDVHEAYLRDPAALEQRIHEVASPTVGPLVDDWLAWLRSPGVLSPKTRRPYAASTVERYDAIWTRLLAVLPRGRESSLSDLTRGFVADYRVARKKEARGQAPGASRRAPGALATVLRAHGLHRSPTGRGGREGRRACAPLG
jgi:hypothetical protein